MHAKKSWVRVYFDSPVFDSSFLHDLLSKSMVSNHQNAF